jgi:hypothetical protein
MWMYIVIGIIVGMALSVGIFIVVFVVMECKRRHWHFIRYRFQCSSSSLSLSLCGWDNNGDISLNGIENVHRYNHRHRQQFSTLYNIVINEGWHFIRRCISFYDYAFVGIFKHNILQKLVEPKSFMCIYCYVSCKYLSVSYLHKLVQPKLWNAGVGRRTLTPCFYNDTVPP